MPVQSEAALENGLIDTLITVPLKWTDRSLN